jgi:23S rRNA (uracil1939-C5)-methyltransferase
MAKRVQLTELYRNTGFALCSKINLFTHLLTEKNIMSAPNEPLSSWHQGALLTVEITDINDVGEGVGRVDNQVVFVPDTAIGDWADVRLVRLKRNHGYGQLQHLVIHSPDRVRANCIVADKCGGCQLQHISYEAQIKAKHNQVVQAMGRIGGIPGKLVLPTIAADEPLGYRNKVTYPLGMSATGKVKAGYYQKGTHKIVNINQCPIQDRRLNSLLEAIKQDAQEQEWLIYDPERLTQVAQLRHLSFRIGRRTGEILVTLVATDGEIPNGLLETAQRWLELYPEVVGVCLNRQNRRDNVIFGPVTQTVAGRDHIREIFADLQWQLGADTFFQIYTEQAEKMLAVVLEHLNLQGTEFLLDAYCGIGTFSLPLASKVKQVLGIESHTTSVTQAQINGRLNNIENVEFQAGDCGELMSELEERPDIVLLDPPRQGCDRLVIETLIGRPPAQLVYISCKPSTLARDLKILIDSGRFQLQAIQPIDFFPQTAHVECAAFLTRVDD